MIYAYVRICTPRAKIGVHSQSERANQQRNLRKTRSLGINAPKTCQHHFRTFNGTTETTNNKTAPFFICFLSEKKRSVVSGI